MGESDGLPRNPDKSLETQKMNSSETGPVIVQEISKAFGEDFNIDIEMRSFQAVLLFIGLRSYHTVISGSFTNVSIDDISNVRPLSLSKNDYPRILPVAFCAAINSGSVSHSGSFLHPYFWPLQKKRTIEYFNNYKPDQRLAIWHAAEFSSRSIFHWNDEHKRSLEQIARVVLGEDHELKA
jgi:hypothetical protein